MPCTHQIADPRCLIVGRDKAFQTACLKAVKSVEEEWESPDKGFYIELADTPERAAELIQTAKADLQPFTLSLVDLTGVDVNALSPAVMKLWESCDKLQVIVVADTANPAMRGIMAKIDAPGRLLVLHGPCCEDTLKGAIDILQCDDPVLRKSRREVVHLREELAGWKLEAQQASDKLHEEMAARQQVIAERVELERLLLESQKLDSLGVVASGIAHDFNNLLTAILANASLLREAPELSEESNESIDHIQTATMTAAGLCQQMLAYAGKGTRDLCEVDFNHLMHETVGLLRSVISKKARLHVSLSDEVLRANVDATQLKQVIMNLVANASDALDDKPGDIQITTMRETCSEDCLEKLYRTRDLPEGEYIHLIVSDTGCGMPTETLSRAFDPFFTTKFIGRGLGLSAVRGIIRGHHGALRVESTPGVGSVFHLLIPSLPVSSNREPSPGTGSEGLKGRILVVDDEDMVRSSAQKILSRQGYMTVPVENGREALNLLGTDVETFDLVLLDLTMPELSGVETLREMRRLNYTMPVILTSGYNPAKLMEELEEEGPLSFLAKPFGLADLQEKVADTMAFQEEPEMLCETVA